MSAHELLGGSPYRGYTYSYPHKTAHRPIRPGLDLAEVWRGERRDALFLYVHVPFCEMRCGFCNLFTTTGADRDTRWSYLSALRRQAEAVRDRVGEARFARLAVGGGTPTLLDPDQLESLFAMLREVFGVDPAAVPASIETSPKTATAERIELLRALGVRRVSIGVQSFDDGEAHRLGRPQDGAQVERALDTLRDAAFETLNIDLMYGVEGQSSRSFERSIEAALRWRPQELFLYPLYVRQLTGLAKRDGRWDDERLACYRRGRDLLAERGFSAISMRLFRRERAGAAAEPEYRCQEDGMIGLGCGARSYTERLHYSWPYAVGREAIRGIIGAYAAQDSASFSRAHHGVALSYEERVRRYVLMSLLHRSGLDRARFAARFGADPELELPALRELAGLGLAVAGPERMVLTESGFERSDAIGPWLYSASVASQMEGFAWR